MKALVELTTTVIYLLTILLWISWKQPTHVKVSIRCVRFEAVTYQ